MRNLRKPVFYLTVALLTITLYPTITLAKATTSHETFIIDFNITGFVSCALDGLGEVVAISGPLLVEVTETIDSQGGLHVQVEGNPQGITGQGLTSGIRYDGRGQFSESLYIANGGFPFHFSLTDNFLLVGRGSLGGKLIATMLVQISINANGDMTVNIDKANFHCN